MAINPGEAYATSTSIVGVTDAATFIPEIWSDEIRASYESNLVLANLVKRIPMKGRKGDTVHIPAPTRGSAAAKAENTAVTIQNATEGTVDIAINQHYEYSRFVEDIVEVQALSSLRKFYTEDAGYALAKQVDTHLFYAATGLGAGTLNLAPGTVGTPYENTGVFYYDATGNALTAYEDDTVEDTDVVADSTEFDTMFRALIQKMDDADVPMTNRSFVTTPGICNTMRGVDRYVSSDFVNQGKVVGGKFGQLYGVDVYVSTNCPVIEDATSNTATTSTLDMRGSLMIHRDTFVMAEQQSIRSQTQYKQEYLATLYTADCLYGVQALRPDSGFMLVYPDA